MSVILGRKLCVSKYDLQKAMIHAFLLGRWRGAGLRGGSIHQPGHVESCSRRFQLTRKTGDVDFQSSASIDTDQLIAMRHIWDFSAAASTTKYYRGFTFECCVRKSKRLTAAVQYSYGLLSFSIRDLLCICRTSNRWHWPCTDIDPRWYHSCGFAIPSRYTHILSKEKYTFKQQIK